MKIRELLVAGIVILSAAVVLAVWASHRQVLLGRQIRNLELFKSYSRALEAFEGTHGHYPVHLDAVSAEATWPQLEPGQDIWGHPIRYISTGDHYVLASTGRNGRPDYDGYDHFLNVSPEPANICLDWNADQVFSDSGWHQACWK